MVYYTPFFFLVQVFALNKIVNIFRYTVAFLPFVVIFTAFHALSAVRSVLKYAAVYRKGDLFAVLGVRKQRRLIGIRQKTALRKHARLVTVVQQIDVRARGGYLAGVFGLKQTAERQADALGETAAVLVVCRIEYLRSANPGIRFTADRSAFYRKLLCSFR